jgi:hypothetical protein
MGTTNTRGKAARALGGRLRPHLDRLEGRLALSASALNPALIGSISNEVGGLSASNVLSIASTSPANSAVLSGSPSALLVTFDRPIDGFSLDNGDFVLARVASDGSTTPLGAGEARLNEALDASDPSGRRLALTPTKPLVSGRYQLLLEGTNRIRGLDQSSLPSQGPSALVADFSIDPPSSGLAGSVNLNTIGSTESIASGVLDLTADPGAVKYYKLTLAPGHHWRLGLAVTSLADGGTLATTLSLFDASGHLISTDSRGLPIDPNDSYLFAGLGPGTYYVGISARGNVPDASGVYDPSGTVLGASSAGGPFRLHAIADIADQPTQVLGLRLDHADPLSKAPSGLTLQFSGPIQTTVLADPSHPVAVLVDRDGKTWPVTVAGYNGITGQLSFLFDRPLDPGSYKLELAGDGLVDLAGMAPVAQGQAPGVLGAFKVSPSVTAVGDLGPILPAAADSGRTATFDVGGNSSTSRQFVVVRPGVYAIDNVGTPSGVSLGLLDGRGILVASGASIKDVTLKLGQYTLVASNSGTQPSAVTITIRQKSISYSQFLEGGVAQGPAFSLRLVTPEANFGQGSDAPTSLDNLAPSGTNPQPSSPSSTATATAGAGQGSSGSGRDLATGATPGTGIASMGVPSVAGMYFGSSSASTVGRPSALSSQISAVGPSGPSGSVALASISSGLPAGLIVNLTPVRPGDLDVPEVIPAESDGGRDGVPTAPRTIGLELGLLSRPAGSHRADDRILADADWIDRLVSGAFGWLEGAPESAPTTVAGDGPAIALEPAVESGSGGEEHRLETASLSSPVVIGAVVVTLAYRYRQALTGKSGGRCKGGPKQGARVPLVLAGPHRRTRSMMPSS